MHPAAPHHGCGARRRLLPPARCRATSHTPACLLLLHRYGPASPLHTVGMAPLPPVELIPEIQHVIEVDDMEATPWPWRCSRREVVGPLLPGELLLAKVNPLELIPSDLLPPSPSPLSSSSSSMSSPRVELLPASTLHCPSHANVQRQLKMRGGGRIRQLPHAREPSHPSLISTGHYYSDHTMRKSFIHTQLGEALEIALGTRQIPSKSAALPRLGLAE
jgi:hypothetical protein